MSSSIFRNSSVTKDDIKVRVSRDDGQELRVETYFLNHEYLGTPDALLLRMGNEVKEHCGAGRRVHVEVWVTNHKIKLEYWFTLFDSKNEAKFCLYNGDSSVCDSYEDGYKLVDVSGLHSF